MIYFVYRNLVCVSYILCPTFSAMPRTACAGTPGLSGHPGPQVKHGICSGRAFVRTPADSGQDVARKSSSKKKQQLRAGSAGWKVPQLPACLRQLSARYCQQPGRAASRTKADKKGSTASSVKKRKCDSHIPAEDRCDLESRRGDGCSRDVGPATETTEEHQRRHHRPSQQKDCARCQSEPQELCFCG